MKALDVAVPLSFRCAACQQAQAYQLDFVGDYFSGRRLECGLCDHPIDLFDVVRDTIAVGYFAGDLFAALGATMRQFTVRLNRHLPTMIDLHEQGVPASARVLAIAYVPQSQTAWCPPDEALEGALFPVEHHQLFSTRQVPQQHITLHSRPVPLTGNAVTTDLLVIVYWVNVAREDVAWSNLVSSFEAFFAEDYSAAIIPANVAIEARLAPLVERYLVERVELSSTRLKQLRTDLVYGVQLDVLLPTLVHLTSAPPITKTVLDHLRGLKSVRNDLAHRGAPERPLDRTRAAAFLAAAVLAFGYLGKLEEHWFPATASS